MNAERASGGPVVDDSPTLAILFGAGCPLLVPSERRRAEVLAWAASYGVQAVWRWGA